MAIVLHHLDKPLTILGVKLSSIGLAVGSFLFGALFESLFVSSSTLLLLALLKKLLGKRPKFTIARWIYRAFPTKSPLFGKSLESMIESHKEAWCK